MTLSAIYRSCARDHLQCRLEVLADLLNLAQIGTEDFDADRRANSVESISMRFLMGIVQAFATPGSRSFLSISATNSSHVIGRVVPNRKSPIDPNGQANRSDQPAVAAIPLRALT